MSETTINQELISAWTRSMEQGMEAWLKLAGQSQTSDASQFWRPMFGQSLDVWTQILQQGAGSPDVLTQWKRFLDDSLDAWSKVLEQAMGSDGFSAAMGKFLNQYLNTVGPMRKSLQSSNEEFLRTMNLPSRKQVTELASQVVSLEARLDALETRIEELIEGVAAIENLMKRSGGA
jgi:hypothetical protein